MQRISKFYSILILTIIALLAFGTSLSAQESTGKSTKTVYVQRHVAAPAERAWEALVLDYGEISNFSPVIYTSDYVRGSLKGEVGATRTCAFNESGSRWVKEKILSIDQQTMTMVNKPFEGGKLPLNFGASYAVYRVVPLDDGTSLVSYTFHYRTKPAFLGGFVKGAFRKQLNETLIGLEHYLTTGERVTGGTDKAREVISAYKDSGEYEDFMEAEGVSE